MTALRFVLLAVAYETNGEMFAVGPFTSREAARAYEDDNEHWLEARGVIVLASPAKAPGISRAL